MAKRYAGALFGLAEGVALDVVARDLAALQQMLADSADLRQLVASPVVGHAAQAAVINALAEKAGFDGLTRRFLGVVAANHRLFALEAIAKAFLAELATRRGELQAEVISARPLSPAQVSAVENGLNKALSAKTTLVQQVDPALLGGLVIRVGSQLIDASLKSRLDRLGHVLKTAA